MTLLKVIVLCRFLENYKIFRLLAYFTSSNVCSGDNLLNYMRKKEKKALKMKKKVPKMTNQAFSCLPNPKSEKKNPVNPQIKTFWPKDMCPFIAYCITEFETVFLLSFILVIFCLYRQ